MPTSQPPGVLRQLEHLLRPHRACELSDGQLLDQFVRRHDETAFEALLRRHGPLVLGVAGRVLADPHDAEDVFQAAFLILARRAGCLRQQGSLAPWLYTVARRLALRLRARAARRRLLERQADPMRNRDPHADLLWRDLRPVLDAEIERLPVKYRTPILLCYLQGETVEEASRRLGWPRGTMAGRLARGRALLRDRLTRRGITLGAATLAALLPDQIRAGVPAVLAANTRRAALACIKGSLTTEMISSGAWRLAHQALSHPQFSAC